MRYRRIYATDQLFGGAWGENEAKSRSAAGQSTAPLFIVQLYAGFIGHVSVHIPRIME